MSPCNETNQLCTLVTSSPSAFTTINIGHGPLPHYSSMALFSQYTLHLLRGLSIVATVGMFVTYFVVKHQVSYKIILNFSSSVYLCFLIWQKHFNYYSYLQVHHTTYSIAVYRLSSLQLARFILISINLTESSTDSVAQPRVACRGRYPFDFYVLPS